MKGFKIPKRMAVLKFEDTDYLGAEVTVALDVSIAFYLEFQALGAKLGDEGNLGSVNDTFRMFGDEILDSWNLEGINADGEGMTRIPYAFANVIIAAWLEAMGVVPDPLGGQSADGEQSPEPLAETEQKSLSRSN
jgi:hypothetical protein